VIPGSGNEPLRAARLWHAPGAERTPVRDALGVRERARTTNLLRWVSCAFAIEEHRLGE